MLMRPSTIALLAVLAFAPTAPALAADPAPETETTDAAATAGSGADYDPWQRMNRGIFWLNDRADHYVLEPVAKGWDVIMPEPAETSVSNFFTNLRFPVVMLNNVLQGKPGDAAIDVGRFMVNTTFGIGGLFDPATIWGLERHSEDFGQTLGVWGAQSGPYIMLPLLGPSNARDTVGRAGDWFINPLNDCCISTDERVAIFGTSAVSEREANIEVIDDLRANSLDLYATVRTVYTQRRDTEIRNGAPAGGQGGYDEIFQDED
jgi:phospholipid-binding lipoprotein MlaA